jgi:AraC-like DNA-binding protein
MNRKFSQSLDDLKDVLISADNYNEDIFILEFDHSAIPNLRKFIPITPSRFDSFIFIGVENGSVEIQIDYINYVAADNALVMIMPSHIAYFISGSHNFKGWVISVSQDFLSYMSRPQQPVVISYLQLKKNPVVTLFADEFVLLSECFDLLRRKIQRRVHIFYDDVVIQALRLFFYELGNIYLSIKENHVKSSFSREEEIFETFQKLLIKNCVQQHEVSFYASKLCITTQYLSRILNALSGKSASQWIANALLTEAKSLLRNYGTSVQQVAEQLNFPDASSFGKFFRRHTGLSPLAFRKNTTV